MGRAFAPLMRTLAMALCLLAGAVVAAPAHADEAADRAALDRLFAELRTAPDAAAAQRIDDQIWRIWTSPSDDNLRLRMLDVLEARSNFDLRRALKLLDVLVADFPDYAEAWNQRATIHYMLGDTTLGSQTSSACSRSSPGTSARWRAASSSTSPRGSASRR